ncbi:unnamed protein product [Heligmosomoides polygyrus]|uniref:SCP domain-containing protein n=1 Tax=Heligmosomoides polygyrus TaxID=6339 RepID=A0A183GW22_HELPZ|nr:unnamed protein product [Heligmosomoides polygyrus]
MYLMVYNCEAEAYAHSVARHCLAGPSPASLRPGWKENFHVLRTTQTDIYGAIQNAIDTWSGELYSYGAPSNVIYTQQMHNKLERRRFTKMIWGASREVGCATHVCQGSYYNTICLYRSFVNTIGANIYPIGPICGACPAGPNNCNTAVGLCSW